MAWLQRNPDRFSFSGGVFKTWGEGFTAKSPRLKRAVMDAIRRDGKPGRAKRSSFLDRVARAGRKGKGA